MDMIWEGFELLFIMFLEILEFIMFLEKAVLLCLIP
jgi:hypothetical protein